MYSNDGINGPWIPYKNEITLITNRTANWTTNPAPLILNNGTIVFVYRESAQNWPYVYPANATSERLGISISNNFMFNGPFQDITEYEPIQNFPLEDAYIWYAYFDLLHI